MGRPFKEGDRVMIRGYRTITRIMSFYSDGQSVRVYPPVGLFTLWNVKDLVRPRPRKRKKGGR